MDRPAITVVMPAFNAEPFIADAVRSILNQHFSRFEFIIVDDASTDKTPDILKSFADERVVIHRNLVNLGEAASFNIGLELAKGEFVARLDADDIAELDRLEIQHAFMTAHPDVTVCGAIMTVFGDRSGYFAGPEGDADIKANFMAAMDNIMNPTAFFRRNFALDHSIRCNPRYVVGVDLAFWIDFMRCGANFANIMRPLVRYRIHSKSLVRTRPKSSLLEILTGLATSYFPQMSPAEIGGMMRCFFPAAEDFSPERAHRIAAACDRAVSDHRAYFGENRQLLHEIIANQFKTFLRGCAQNAAAGVARAKLNF
jgi:glycosyltransferase involved in cell wall biosynthesis